MALQPSSTPVTILSFGSNAQEGNWADFGASGGNSGI